MNVRPKGCVVTLEDGREFSLSDYPSSYVDWIREERLGNVDDYEVAEYMSDDGLAPEDCPIEVINLNVQGGCLFVPGDAPADLARDVHVKELVGFSADLFVDRYDDGRVAWSNVWYAGRAKEPYETNGPLRVQWCFEECRGPWLLMMGDYNRRSEEYAVHVMLLNTDDQTRFDAEFPFDVRHNDPRPALALKAKSECGK